MNIAHNLDTNLLEIKEASAKRTWPQKHRGWLAALFG